MNPAPLQVYGKGGKPPTEDDLGAFYRDRMTAKREAQAILQGQGVYVPRRWARRWDIVTACYLGYFVHYAGTQKNPDGWIWKSAREMEEESGITRSQQDRARRTLVEAGVIETKTGGIGNRTHVRVNIPLLKLIDDLPSAEVADAAVERAVADDTQPGADNPQAVARIPQTHNRNTAETPSPPERSTPVSRPVAPTAHPRAQGSGGIDQAKVERCVNILRDAEGLKEEPSVLAEIVATQMLLYPRLEPVRVCEGVRGYAVRNLVRYPTRLLETFFERAEQERGSEQMNPHSPEGERAKDTPMRADWYTAFYDVSVEEVQQMNDRGMTHPDILAALKGRERG